MKTGLYAAAAAIIVAIYGQPKPANLIVAAIAGITAAWSIYEARNQP